MSSSIWKGTGLLAEYLQHGTWHAISLQTYTTGLESLVGGPLAILQAISFLAAQNSESSAKDGSIIMIDLQSRLFLLLLDEGRISRASKI